jgi:tRNA pseudouridine38-40 synthase
MSLGPKVKLLISYDGGAFAGWQRQRHAPKPTGQGTVEALLSKIFNEEVKVVGASRTDAGVHALGQVAHFRAPKPIAKYNLMRSLNAMAPEDLVFKGVWEAPEDFHALASSHGKTYRYLIHNHPIRSALRHRHTAWVPQKLDIDFLNQASACLLGTHDFKSFQTAGSDVKTTTREIKSLNWQAHAKGLVEFSITGSGFLKQMVRNIVGTLLDLHQDKETPEMMKEILNARDRGEALGTAAPQGLYLVRVHYPEDLDIRCRKL